ncbi:MAG: hypothetical protein M3O70_01005, partial [Actinomycetota bacterium]|nr:hypothetical protein [Actinomycetota bacterium]
MPRAEKCGHQAFVERRPSGTWLVAAFGVPRPSRQPRRSQRHLRQDQSVGHVEIRYPKAVDGR